MSRWPSKRGPSTFEEIEPALPRGHSKGWSIPLLSGVEPGKKLSQSAARKHRSHCPALDKWCGRFENLRCLLVAVHK